jgi:hypothetical protein
MRAKADMSGTRGFSQGRDVQIVAHPFAASIAALAARTINAS